MFLEWKPNEQTNIRLYIYRLSHIFLDYCVDSPEEIKFWSCWEDSNCERHVADLNLPEGVTISNLKCIDRKCKNTEDTDDGSSEETTCSRCHSDFECNKGRFPSGVVVTKKFKCIAGRCLADGKKLKLASCYDEDCNAVFPSGAEIVIPRDFLE